MRSFVLSSRCQDAGLSRANFKPMRPPYLLASLQNQALRILAALIPRFKINLRSRFAFLTLHSKSAHPALRAPPCYELKPHAFDRILHVSLGPNILHPAPLSRFAQSSTAVRDLTTIASPPLLPPPPPFTSTPRLHFPALCSTRSMFTSHERRLGS